MKNVIFIFLYMLTLQSVLANIYHDTLKELKDSDSLTKNSTLKKESKATVFYFLSSTCPCSQAHFDHLNGLQKKYKQFQFIGLHSQKSITRKKAKKYFDQYQIDFPIFMDRELKIANLLKALKTPHVFVLSPVGEILFQGGATNSRNPKRASKFYLNNALENLSNNNPVQTKVAKALGCYIMR